MNKEKEKFHGSDVEKMEAIYGIAKEKIVQFSGNVNPLGISPKLKKELSGRVDEISSYPDRDYTNLRIALAKYLATDKDNILVGNGATELISLLIKNRQVKNALVIGPTYSEYEREIIMSGGQASYHQLKEDQDYKLDIASLKEDLSHGVDMLIICNPNNPTSRSIYRDEIKEIVGYCKSTGVFVMIDETYVEFTEDLHQITAIPLINNFDNLVVLRGVSKFYSAPGLRLGYALGNKKLVDQVNKIKNPWSLNSLAAIAGEIMFTDKEYIQQTKALINQERARAVKTLDTCKNLKYFSPSANFVLVKILKEDVKSHDIFEAAIAKGYMIRDCSNFKFLNDKFFRFCFMMPQDNEQLLNLILEKLN